jgi:hypothetical protein
VDGHSPDRVRRFVQDTNILDARTPEQWQLDAFGQVDAWLRALGLRGTSAALVRHSNRERTQSVRRAALHRFVRARPLAEYNLEKCLIRHLSVDPL